MPKAQPSILHVEGKDDVHAIGHLLLRHGIDCESIPVSIKHSGADGDDASGGVNRLLAGMPVDVMASTGRRGPGVCGVVQARLHPVTALPLPPADRIDGRERSASGNGHTSMPSWYSRRSPPYSRKHFAGG